MSDRARSTRPGEPEGTVRPFVRPEHVADPTERIAHALESIAVTLAAIDHNLEVLIGRISRRR